MSGFGRCIRLLGRSVALVGLLAAGLAWQASLQAAPKQPATRPPPLGGPMSVLDGDTLEISGRRYDLAGIDAPELDQTCLNDGRPWLCGVNAAFELKKILDLGEIGCRPVSGNSGNGQTARLVCASGTQDVAAMLVAAGEAVADDGGTPSYAHLQQQARTAGLGLWRGPFISPPEWRAGHRTLDDGRLFHPACMIKGVRMGADRVFVLPTDEAYATTKISRADGDTMLCTVEEAEAYGWSHATVKP